MKECERNLNSQKRTNAQKEMSRLYKEFGEDGILALLRNVAQSNGTPPPRTPCKLIPVKPLRGFILRFSGCRQLLICQLIAVQIVPFYRRWRYQFCFSFFRTRISLLPYIFVRLDLEPFQAHGQCLSDKGVRRRFSSGASWWPPGCLRFLNSLTAGTLLMPFRFQVHLYQYKSKCDECLK